MRSELAVFTTQLQEMEQRSSLTFMFSSYLNLSQVNDDLKVFQGISHQKQFFLLRKQYDSRMKQLSQILINQRHKIQKFDNYIDTVLKQRALLENQMNADFDSNFNYLFMEKVRLVTAQKNSDFNSFSQTMVDEEQISRNNTKRKQDSYQKKDQQHTASASLTDINEIINNLSHINNNNENTTNSNFNG